MGRRETRAMCVALAGLLVPVVAASGTIVSYGWEDGGTILGSQGNLANPYNASGPDPVRTGLHSLSVSESPEGGTPSAYVAFIQYLSATDIVSVDIWGYDTTPGVLPSMRMGAHYALNGNINSNQGDAGNLSNYTDGNGWKKLIQSWTIPAGKEALVIEVFLYSPAQPTTTYFVDDIKVTAPDHAAITAVPEPALGVLCSAGLGTLVLLARRQTRR